MNYRYIADQDSFEALAGQLQDAQWLGLDTEFIREKTYWPQLCLLQISAAHELALVDMLTVTDLGPLHGLLHSTACSCILHAPDQDLDALYQAGIPQLHRLFDTQIAAAMLGHPEQMGYAALVEAVLGISLDKEQQRTDWSRRPLHPAQLAYAADDVRHLRPLQAALSEQLEIRGRLDWLEEDSQRLSQQSRYQPAPEQAWRRLRGIQRLQADEQCVAVALASWRERRALASNRPRRWILADELIYKLARKHPGNTAQMAECGLPPALIRQHGQALLEVCVAARITPANVPGPLDQAQRKQLERMTAALHREAELQQVSASVLATRAELEALLRGEQPPRLLGGWRREVIGNQLQAML